MDPASLGSLPVLSGALDRALRLSRFKLEAPAGSGGSGQVWYGTDVESGRPVVIKQMTDLEWARREAEVMRRLADSDNPHLPRLLEYVESDQRAWLVYDRGPGEAHPTVPVAQAVAAAVNFALALDEVHQLTLLHNDLIHPGNVLMDGANPERSMVIDFGNAIPPGQHPFGRKSVLAFAPPELIQDNAVKDPSSDLFGVVGWAVWMATGHLPFHFPPGMAGTPENFLELQRSGPDLSGIDDPALQEVFRKALAYDRQDRFPDGPALAQALGPFTPPDFVPTTSGRSPPLPDALPSKAVYQAAVPPMASADGGYDKGDQGGYLVMATPGLSRPGHMVFGPYLDLAPGSYRADFLVRSSVPKGVMARLDVWDNTHQLLFAEHGLVPIDLSPGHAWTRVTLPFEVREAGHPVEFRVYWMGTADLQVGGVRLR